MPQAFTNNHFNFYSSVVVQNASGSAVNVTLDIFTAGSSSPVYTETKSNVPAYASVNFEQQGNASLAANTPYSARITATGPVAPVVTVYGMASANNQLYSYNPFQAGAKTMYAPVVMKNYFGYNSALVIQNMGTTTTNVTVNLQHRALPVPGLGAGAAGRFTSRARALRVCWQRNPPACLRDGDLHHREYRRAGATSRTITIGGQLHRLLWWRHHRPGPGPEKPTYYNSSVTCQVLSGGPASPRIEYFEGGASKS
jgi:hypothetical protein